MTYAREKRFLSTGDLLVESGFDFILDPVACNGMVGENE